MLKFLAAIMLAYLLGAFPTAYLLAKAMGKDIFQLGSGNPGAMNSFRNLGKKAGIAVFIVDIIKGFLAIALARAISPEAVNYALVAVVAGHAWSVFVALRGGKALAAGFGAFLAIKPLFALSILLSLAVSILLLGKKSNLAVAVVIALYPIGSFAYEALTKNSRDHSFSITLAAMAAIIIYKHLPAIKAELSDKNPDKGKPTTG